MKKSNVKDRSGTTELLTRLNFLLHLSGRAYEKYMGNKIYLHARNIRKANELIYQLLIDEAHFIPDELQKDCIELLNHYDCWMLQFKEEEQVRKPSLADEFVFQRMDNQVAYPRLSESRLFEAYMKLKKQKK